jgi:hypothetical protein
MKTMGDWDTTYTPNMSPFSFNAGNDQIAGLSPFGSKLAAGIGGAMQGIGAAMSGGQHPIAQGAQGLAQGINQFAQPQQPSEQTGAQGDYLRQLLMRYRTPQA